MSTNPELPNTKDMLLEHLFAVVAVHTPRHAEAVTGMFAELDAKQLMQLLGSQSLLQQRINTAVAVLEGSIEALNTKNSNQQGNLSTATRSPGHITGSLKDISGGAAITSETEALGEALFTRVAQIESELCAQITGMLLELDKTTVERLVADPEDLLAAVNKAKQEFLQLVTKQDSTPAPELESLGEQLHGVVAKVYPENAAKITGMLLEAGPNRIQELLLDPDQGCLGNMVSRSRQALMDTGQWLPESGES